MRIQPGNGSCRFCPSRTGHKVVAVGFRRSLCPGTGTLRRTWPDGDLAGRATSIRYQESKSVEMMVTSPARRSPL
jgi:hypothetical protein